MSKGTNHPVTKPAISWPGGKSKLLQYILPLIPEHTCYCEPFAGGLAVLLSKKRSPVEVINDLNSDLVNFYRCARFHCEALDQELHFILNSRQEFNDFRVQKGLTDIQRAARWFYRNKNCFGGCNLDSFGFSRKSGGGAMGSRFSRTEAVCALNRRLDSVCIENLDWKRCCELYDSPETFFFFDPPYTECDATMYDSWKEADVSDFAETIQGLQGKWVITFNDHPAIREVFKDCKIKAITRQKGINNKDGPRVYKEIIVSKKAD
jgi:DNA adenine methylase